MEEDILIEVHKSNIQTEIDKLNDAKIIFDSEHKNQMFNMINEIDTKVQKILLEENNWIIDSYPQLETDILMIKSLPENRRYDYLDDIIESVRDNKNIGIRSKKYQSLFDLINIFKEKLILRLLFEEKSRESIISNNISIAQQPLITQQSLIIQQPSLMTQQSLMIQQPSIIINQQLLRDTVETCRFKCEFCQKQQNPLMFCSDGFCVKCEATRKEIEKNMIANTKKEVKQTLIKASFDDRIINDTYFFITLNVSEEDGSIDHIRSSA